ncbi:hypothetical protein BC332_27280 [Capsicum chinense]|nr:hypothetical protein BC332_27280 [Capsicum chinense]
MEVQKRKFLHEGEMEVKKQVKTEKIDGKSKTATPSEAAPAAEVAVEDDEVEEFYAILRRIRVAVKYFGKGTTVDGFAGRNLTAATPWKSVFKRNVDDVQEKERVEDNADLDLNADPVTDPNSETH